MHPVRALLIGLVAVLVAASVAAGRSGAPAPVRVIDLSGTLDPVAAQFVRDGITAAGAAGAPAVVIRLDAPGAQAASVRDVVAAIRGSRMPVAVWVGPAGARVGPAGTPVAAAADHVGMAPGTAIASVGAGRAVERGVAQTVQPTVGDFVAWLDGRAGRDGAVIHTAGAPIRTEAMPWYLHALQALADPDLVFLLMLVGLAGIGLELLHPGAILPGLVGTAAMLGAAAGLTVLPFSWVGVGLLLLAVALFVAETQVGGVGALAAGGIGALAVAGAMLFDSADPALRPTLWVVVVVAVVLGAGFTAAARRVMRARTRPVRTGTAELMGVVGTARAPIGPAGGRVLVNGEIWSARTADGAAIPAGQRVRVVRVHTDDLTLTVEPREE